MHIKKKVSGSQTQISVFEGSQVRKLIYNNEWHFVLKDVVFILTNSSNPSAYLKDMRKRDSELKRNWKTFTLILPVDTSGGIQRLNCANTESILRIIQSIPSPKAEPFKLWLAKIGYERIQEIENPHKSLERLVKTYRAKGYSDNWIKKRIQGIEVRQDLTTEWSKRGAKNHKDYSILTAEISNATFGMTPNEYKRHKGITKENLRDHMTDLELIFNMLGERATTEITRNKDSKSIPKLKKDAKKGGGIAGSARKELEAETNRKVITTTNYIDTDEVNKRLY